MNNVTLLLGGNRGNTIQYLIDAKSALQQTIGDCIQTSSVYESEPWGFSDSQWFLNQVVVCRTNLTAVEVLNQCLHIEKMLGRTRSDYVGYEARVIDIDILFYDNTCIDTPQLTIPHPKLHLRYFTLLPLTEIMPDFIHPTLNKKISKLLDECNDKGLCHILEI